MTATAKQVIGLASVLIALALGLMVWKVQSLGFGFWPGEQTDAIEMEAQIRFEAVNPDGDGVRVSLGMPNSLASGMTVLSDAQVRALDYAELNSHDPEDPRLTWTSATAVGPQEVSVRLRAVEISAIRGVYPDVVGPPVVQPPVLPDAQKSFVDQLVGQAKEQSDADDLTLARLLLRKADLKHPTYSDLSGLLEQKGVALQRTLALSAGLPTRTVYTLDVSGISKHQAPGRALQVYVRGSGWQVFDPHAGRPGLPKGTVIWHQGGPLLEVEGGKNSSVTISVQPVTVALTDVVAGKSGLQSVADLKWSLFALPVATQSAFQRLLLVPIGVLVVVLMRNFVGMKTSGTFMPILMALAFVETTLVFGLVLFALIIALGVMLRGYLTSMNLLLVPRIGAVVILVILLMLGIAIVANALGLGGGVAITFFPMIILAWTIERLSIAAEEAGSGEALQQIGGSLFVAVCAYLCMDNAIAKHVTFHFPEVCLIIMALVLLIGIYSGFRLTELRRFEPLARLDQPSGSPENEGQAV
jgi:hypothetical protein